MTTSPNKFILYLVTLLTLIVVILLAVRIVLTPVFMEVEYRLPGFPDDPYGFTQAERIKYAHVARRYVLSDPAVPSLADQRFPEGQLVPEFSCQFMTDCSYMYNEREVQHMLDVKNVISAAMLVLGVSLVALFSLGAWSRAQGWWSAFLRALRRGAWLTLILIAAILAFVVLAFRAIFVLFHQVFFAAGTWVFYYSDTLIRLFPERFWQDAFAAVGLLAAVQAGLILLLTHSRRKAEPQP